MNKYVFVILFLLTLTGVLAYDSADLISYYDFNTTSNISQFTDLKSGFTLLTSTNTSKYLIDGVKDTALYYGSTIAGHTPYNATLSGYDLSDSFSVNFWTKFPGYSNIEYLVSIANDSGTRFFTVRPMSNASATQILNVGFNGSATSDFDIIYGYTLNESHFDMITATYDGATLKLYINGTLRASHDGVMRDNSNLLRVGILSNDSIDELSIWNTELSLSDISILYNNGDGLSYDETLMQTSFTGNTTCQVTVSASNTKRDYSTDPYFPLNTESFFLYPYQSSIGIPYQSQLDFTIDGAPGYYAVTCNYSESEKFAIDFDSMNASLDGFMNTCSQDNYIGIYSALKGYSMLLNETCNNSRIMIPITDNNIYTDKIIEFSTYTQDANDNIMHIQNPTGNDIITIIQSYNANSSQVCYYHDSKDISDLIFCGNYNTTDITPLNNNGAIYHYLIISYTESTYMLRIVVSDKDNHIVSEGSSNTFPILLTSQPSYLKFESGLLSWFDDVRITELSSSYPSYKAFNGSITSYCGYGLQSSGTLRMRVYVNSQNDTVYNACYGARITFRTLEQQSTDITAPPSAIIPGVTKKLSLQEKHMLYAYLITFLVAFACAVCVGIATRGSEKAGAVAFLVFLFVALVGLIVFGFIGWLSLIFAILTGLLDAIFIIIGFKMLFFQTAG